MAFIYNWLWPENFKEVNATDAAHNPMVRQHFIQFLDNTEPPDTFTPTQVAKSFKPAELRTLGYNTWQEMIPCLYELTWELREFGDLTIYCNGEEVPEDVLFYDLKGSIKIMRREL
ncbi:hypothetical protein AMS68_007628 [Peltaster fructicola]|uniref:Uncharacterized protein n=1 Tax=Peltaster fructicola TaxID=286661 RepID=A0A6H0Y5B1_9PEZI|nr:hypothetical protein AMS68_007628 [Peltaster fructicola]